VRQATETGTADELVQSCIDASRRDQLKPYRAQVEIAVADTGSGIAPGDAPRLFDPPSSHATA
jgi:signal transduction histidine kinase